MNQVGYLPVYAGRRYQRGGGILSSIGRMLLPIAKRGVTALAKGFVKNAPEMIDQVVNQNLTPKQALIRTAKNVGREVVRDVGGQFIGTKKPTKRTLASRPPVKRVPKKKRRRDIFSA